MLALLALLQADGPSSLAQVVSNEDYPTSAISKDETGTVEVDLLITSEGKVGGCTLLTSSGSDALDFRTCQLIRDRARFQPAKDANGQPIASHYRQRIRWEIEEPEPEPEPAKK